MVIGRRSTGSHNPPSHRSARGGGSTATLIVVAYIAATLGLFPTAGATSDGHLQSSLQSDPELTSIVTLRIDGDAVQAIVSGSHDIQPTWSPTGSAIAFVSDRFEWNRDLFTKSLGTGYVTRLTMSPADDVQPAWSPDGAHIAFASLRTGVMNIFEVPSSGGTVSRLTDSTTGSYQYPSWSPTGADFV